MSPGSAPRRHLSVEAAEVFHSHEKRPRIHFFVEKSREERSLPEVHAVFFRIAKSGPTLCSAQHQLPSTPPPSSTLLFLCTLFTAFRRPRPICTCEQLMSCCSATSCAADFPIFYYSP
ncbi:unnamed protein product, partial [Sphacelaria rigidula]